MAYTPENNPYIPGDPYSYDLKWIVNNIKDLIANYTGQIDELKAFIMDYINSLDLSPIVAAELQKMYDNGDFDALIASFITDNKVVLVDTDQSAAFTEAEKDTGRKNLRAGSTNPNMLDNPFFQVNQRGGANYTNSFSVDRWLVYNASAAVGDMFNNGFITLTYSASGAGFLQRMPYNAAFIGKQFTLSVMFSDGEIFTSTLTMPSTGSVTSPIFRNIKLGLATTTTFHQFTIHIQTPDTNPSIKAAKLELGNVSTLANDAAPNYAQELAKCQYYFMRLQNTYVGLMNMATGYCVATTTAECINVTGGRRMRANPTLSSNGTFTFSGQNVTSFAIVSGTEGGLLNIRAITNGGLTQGDVGLLVGSQGAYIDLSADL